MAIKIKGITLDTEDKHGFWDHYAFVDSDGDFFIICEYEHVVRMCESFPEENVSEYESIEDFLKERFGTKLVKALEKDDFDVEITVK